MSEPASISAGIAERYATAIFEIAQESKALASLETTVADLAAALAESDDLNELISSPVIPRSEQKTAILAIADKMGVDPVVRNALGLMADKRRLFVLPQLVSALQAMLAEERDEVTAEVTSAKALTKAQTEKLTATLSSQMGKSVVLTSTVDDSLIGGLIVKVGSKLIDTSVRAKLNALQTAMKEVG